MSTTTVTIGSRFCGPPNSANGGYACGVVANCVEGKAVEVTLKSPPPLDTPLTVERAQDLVLLRHGELLVAQGGNTDDTGFTIPERASVAEAEQSARALDN